MDLTLTGFRINADSPSLDVDRCPLGFHHGLNLVETTLIENNIIILLNQLLIVFLPLLIKNTVLKESKQKDEKNEQADRVQENHNFTIHNKDEHKVVKFLTFVVNALLTPEYVKVANDEEAKLWRSKEQIGVET